MDSEKKECKALKLLSLIVMIIFLLAGILLIIFSGNHYAKFFNRFAVMYNTEHWMLPCAISTVVLKTIGAFLLMWSFLLYKLIQNPLRNAIVATGSGVGFLLIAAVTVSHFFSKEIIGIIPPFIMAIRVLVTATLGFLFLIWTPKQ